MFYTLISTDTYHPTRAGEIETVVHAKETKMALLAAMYKEMGRKANRKNKSILALLTGLIGL